ncbi:Uncharacterised protein [Bordetella pertussis]|nr:Uncharacterised protein [Bordetella pertussis]
MGEAAGEGRFDRFAQLERQLLAVIGQQLGQVGFDAVDNAAHAVGAFAHHRGQALAFAGAAFLHLRQRLLGGLHAGRAPGLRIERVVAALAGPVEQFDQARRGDFGQDGARVVQLRGQRAQPLRVQRGEFGGGGAGIRHAHFDLAARQLGGQQFAQRRLDVAQLVGQAEIQVEITAVDAAQLERERALLEVGAGVAEGSHAADHGEDSR